MAAPKRICIIGSGNWGSVIAKIVGDNVAANPSKWVQDVQMYVYEEMIDGQKLTEIINTKHENVKYLPGHTLPKNIIANPDAKATAKDADILIFVVPHQFIHRICADLKGNLKPGALGVSLIKGVDFSDKGLRLITDVIRDNLKIECAVLMGANIASEVAKEQFCEATVGCKDPVMGQLLKEVMQTPYFRIVVVKDEATVEYCGALKNIVATGAGFVDGLGLGNNTKAAVIRLGLMEMVKFCQVENPETKIDTFMESCGVADLVTTCYSGRNRKVAEAFVTTGKTIEQLEVEMLNGQRLQGPPTAAEVNNMLKSKGMEDRFPMFTAIHKICLGEKPASAFIDCIRCHPEHM